MLNGIGEDTGKQSLPMPPKEWGNVPDGGSRTDQYSLPIAPNEVPRFDPDILRRYFRYGDWAAERVHAIAAGLSDEQLDHPFEIGLGTLRKTLLHIRDAEQSWLEAWLHGPRPFAQLDEKTSIDELRRLYAETARQRDKYLASLSPADLQRPVTAEVEPELRYTFALGETMFELHGHGTHHRAQAVNMLRHLGAETPELGYRFSM
jgi:uncharacterized damage-inducible protein DinB